MQIQSVNTNRTNQPNFKASCDALVTKKFLQSISMQTPSRKANLAQQAIDIITIFKKIAPQIGKISDAVILKFDSTQNNAVTLMLNNHPFSTMALDDYATDIIANEFVRSATEGKLNYFKIFSLDSPHYTSYKPNPQDPEKVTRSVSRFNQANREWSKRNQTKDSSSIVRQLEKMSIVV